MRPSFAALVVAMFAILPPAGASPALGQNAPKPPARATVPPQTKVAVGPVHDRRSDVSPFRKLEITLELLEIPAAEVAAARTTVTTAVDDTGRDLVPEDSGGEGLQPARPPRAEPEAVKARPAEVVLELKNPARRATAVTTVAGEIELYLPGRDPAAVATIPRIAARAGKPVADSALKANGVTIAVLGKEQLEAEKKRRLESLKQAARKDRISREELQGRIDEFSAGFPQPEEGTLVLKIASPEGRIHDLAYVDAAGEEKFVSASEESGLTLLASWGESPGPDWGLRVRMKTPKTLVRYSYAVRDVPLP